MQDLLDVIENNRVVKIIAPTSYGKTTTIPRELGKRGYRVKVIVSSNKNYNFENVEYVLGKNFKWTKDFDILYIDDVDSIYQNLDALLVISKWKSFPETKIKLVLTGLNSMNLFPDQPNHFIEHLPPIDIKYVPLNWDKPFPFSLVSQVSKSVTNGNFLIFAHNKTDVIENLKKYDIDMEIVSSYDPTKTNRTILVTDKIETFGKNDFVCIFDDMKQEQIVRTVAGGIRKRVTYITKTEAELRSRRSSIPTTVYRFISQEEYNKLPEQSNSILEMPLHHLMLDILKKGYNLDIITDISDKKTETYTREQIDETYKIFLNYGLIDISGKITEKGKTIRKMPLGLKTSLIYLDTDAKILACCIDSFNGQPFVYKSSEKNFEINNHVKKYFNRFRGKSDCETLVNIYNDSLNDRINSLSADADSVSEWSLKSWCQKNYIDYDYLNDVYKTIQYLSLNFPSINTENLLSKNTYMKKLFSDKILKLSDDNNLYAEYKDADDRTFIIDSLSINTIDREKPQIIYGLITTSDRISVTFL